MKSALLTIATGAAPYFDITLPRLARLARLLGADFHCRHIPPPDGVHPAWLKLPLLEQMAHHYERVIWCDADLLPLFSVLTKADLGPLFTAPATLAPDHGMPKTNARFGKFCTKWFGGAVAEGLTYWNAGLMAFSRAVALQLAGAFRMFGKTPNEFFHDQDFINFHLRVGGVEVCTLPQGMNWCAPQHRDATLAQAKIIHFAGGHKNLVPQFATVL